MQPYLTHAGVGVIVDVLVGVDGLLGVGEAVGVGVASGVGVGVGHPGAGTHPPFTQATGPRFCRQPRGGSISGLQFTNEFEAFGGHQQ
jgi:hypothetical protein